MYSHWAHCTLYIFTYRKRWPKFRIFSVEARFVRTSFDTEESLVARGEISAVRSIVVLSFVSYYLFDYAISLILDSQEMQTSAQRLSRWRYLIATKVCRALRGDERTGADCGARTGARCRQHGAGGNVFLGFVPMKEMHELTDLFDNCSHRKFSRPRFSIKDS